MAACALVIGSQGLQNAAANGDTRSISFRHIHTGEILSVTYKREGRYDDAAMKQINHVMRDWRRNEEVRMDPRVIDIIWEVNREVGGKEAVEIICGYRAPATNQMLRKRSRGVAQASQHTVGKAIDFNIPGVALESIRNAGLRLQRGGVGFYPSSQFVHLDVGSVRHWPRMTHDQLARVFPNGRTVHVPSDGKPLSGYALALADVQKRGGAPSQMSIDAADNAGVDTSKPKKSLLAALFGGKDEDDEVEAAADAAAAPAAPASRRTTTPVPLPTARPAITAATDKARDESPKSKQSGAFALASAGSQPIDLAPPTQQPVVENVFTARGLWEGPQGRPEPPAAIPEAEPVQVADASPVPTLGPARMRAERGPADLAITGVVSPRPAGADRVPAELALAYAAQNDGVVAPAAPRAAAMGNTVARAANPNDTLDNEGLTTIIRKTIARAVSPRAVAAVPGPVSSAPRRTVVPASGDTYADPWLGAMLLAPNLKDYLTVTTFDAPDPLTLRPLMVKPDAVVVMTFSSDPHLGMSSERFSGSAVVFVSTVTFGGQSTAMLR